MSESLPQTPDAPALGSQITAALDLALKYGNVDGTHHKMWVIDQMVRALTGSAYDAWVAHACPGEDGPQTYGWNTGIIP